MGDSITHWWNNPGWKPEVSDPEFFSLNNFVETGSPGQQTSGMLSRFDRDVVKQNPKSVIILGGINDIGGGRTAESVFANIKSMAELGEAAGIKVILCSVMPWYQTSAKQRILDTNTLIKEYADENGYPYVDYYKPLSDADGNILSQYFVDGCHPTLEGYKIMESICLPIINATIGK